MSPLTNMLVFLATLAGMEVFAWWAHKYVMHGWGWGWHKSHHEPRSGWFEKNDLYAVVFAGVGVLLIAPDPADRPRHGRLSPAGMDRRWHDGLRLSLLRRP
ncbi:hypothetical protein F753_10730 [Stutzerimonas chloritidismutans AW-1]|uniref:Beta-carotene hydroxylase n=1 Tax=Stutzerimonas chloritidismutans AW-1 TaxID=1263865 RepID=V4QHN5_STUCH|nr:hypothetical protein F753_10730 [Stutzerimonas chloritidismutans AW-1]